MRKNSFSYLRGYGKIIIILILLVSVLPFLSVAQEGAAGTQSKTSPDVEIFLEKGISSWMENNPYMKQIMGTSFWNDFQLSHQFIGLLTLSTELETQMGFSLDKNYIRDLLSCPMEILMWNLFEKEADTQYVVVIDVDPKLQTLIKLGEFYARSTKKSKEIQKDNISFLETEWLDNTLYHVMTKKQLIISNNKDNFIKIMGKQSKESIVTPFRGSEFFKNYHKSEGGNFKCRIDMASQFSKLLNLLNKEKLELAINMDLGEKVEYYGLYMIANPGFKASESGTLEDVGDIIPREPVMAFSGLYTPGYYLGLLEDLDYFKEIKKKISLDLNKDLIPFFGERFFFYIQNFQDAENPKIVNGVLGFSLKKMNSSQQNKIISFLQLLMNNPAHPMSSEKDPGNKKQTIYYTTEPGAPAFCLTDKWLLVGTSYQSLIEALGVGAKKAACLTDGKEYKVLSGVFEKKGFGHLFIDFPRVFASLEKHILFKGEDNANFNVSDVQEKLLPLVKILSGIPPSGIYWELKNGLLRGKMTFVSK